MIVKSIFNFLGGFIVFIGLSVILPAAEPVQEAPDRLPPPIEKEIVQDDELMLALLSEESDTRRDAAIRLIERAGNSQEKLDTFFGGAFEKLSQTPERLSEILGIFDYFNLFSRAAYKACENFIKNHEAAHPVWDEIARSYFHQRFLVNAAVWRSKTDALGEEELLMIRLYSLPVDLWLLRGILTQPERFSGGVQLAAIDALWWVYAMGRVEIHESLAIILENEDISARVFEAAVEPLQYLHVGFAYPQIIPYLQKAIKSKAIAETSEEHREKILGITEMYSAYAKAKWADELKEFEKWFKREEAIRSNEGEFNQLDSATSRKELSGRWLLDKVSCVLENGDEVFIESFENLNLHESQEVLQFDENSRFEIAKSSGRTSSPYARTKVKKFGSISELDEVKKQYLFRVQKEIIQESQDKQEFLLSMLESIERSFEAKLEAQEDALVLTMEKTLKSLGSTDLCLSMKGMKQRKYFKRTED